MPTAKKSDNKKIMVGEVAIYPIRSNVPVPAMRTKPTIGAPIMERMSKLEVGQSFFTKNVKGPSLRSYCQKARQRIFSETGEKRTFISREAIDKYPKGDVEGFRVWRKK